MMEISGHITNPPQPGSPLRSSQNSQKKQSQTTTREPEETKGREAASPPPPAGLVGESEEVRGVQGAQNARNAQGAPGNAEAEQNPAEAVETINAALEEMATTSVRFALVEDTGDVVVQIVDTENNEVIRQIPAEDLQHLKERLTEMRGLLLDEEG